MTMMMEQPPQWRGINFQTSENLNFACTSQLYETYKSCRGFPVSSGIVKAWLLGSYQGSFSPTTGMPEGEGSARLADGTTYTGTFKGGLLHGNGTLTKPDAWSYTGTFSYNCIHGAGSYTWSNEAFYNGEVYQGLPHGEGILYTGEEDSCTYEGSWKHGLRHGQGTITYGKSGTTKYEGRWYLDRKHGAGYHAYDSGTTFRGSWSQGKRSGKGRLVSVCTSKAAACLYGGELGRLNLSSIYAYDGDWLDDLSSGSGKSVWMAAEEDETSNKLLNSYVGQFERGLRHGHGTFYYASGAMYRGEWKDNKKHGDACYINQNGSITWGKFINDHVDGTPVIKEPLQSFFEEEVDFTSEKEKLSNVLLRHNSVLRDVFSKYSAMSGQDMYNQKVGSMSRAINLNQIWLFCYDANIMNPGLGLAQIDWLLRPMEYSWDNCFELHKPSRHFVFREFIDILITISKIKYSEEEGPLHKKVDKLITTHVVPIMSKDSDASPSLMSELDTMKMVLDGYAPQLQDLFNKTLRGIGTSDDTINLRVLDTFFQKFKPQWGLQRDRLLSSVIKGLYHYDLELGVDGVKLLDNDINFMEFQIAILIYANNLYKDQQETPEEPVILLNNFMKEIIVPNLLIDFESLMNEEFMPSLPTLNLKGATGNNKSVPASKRATPRGADGKPQTPFKSAPQTPQRKKR